MAVSSPRIDSRLLAALERLDDRARPIAETHRRLGLVADQLGLCRPSYERVRMLVHELRSGHRGTGAGSLLLDIAFMQRPPEAIIELLME